MSFLCELFRFARDAFQILDINQATPPPVKFYQQNGGTKSKLTKIIKFPKTESKSVETQTTESMFIYRDMDVETTVQVPLNFKSLQILDETTSQQADLDSSQIPEMENVFESPKAESETSENESYKIITPSLPKEKADSKYQIKRNLSLILIRKNPKRILQSSSTDTLDDDNKSDNENKDPIILPQTTQLNGNIKATFSLINNYEPKSNLLPEFPDVPIVEIQTRVKEPVEQTINTAKIHKYRTLLNTNFNRGPPVDIGGFSYQPITQTDSNTSFKNRNNNNSSYNSNRRFNKGDDSNTNRRNTNRDNNNENSQFSNKNNRNDNNRNSNFKRNDYNNENKSSRSFQKDNESNFNKNKNDNRNDNRSDNNNEDNNSSFNKGNRENGRSFNNFRGGFKKGATRGGQSSFTRKRDSSVDSDNSNSAKLGQNNSSINNINTNNRQPKRQFRGRGGSSRPTQNE